MEGQIRRDQSPLTGSASSTSLLEIAKFCPPVFVIVLPSVWILLAPALQMAASFSVVGSELYNYPQRVTSPSPYPKGHSTLPMPPVFYQTDLIAIFIITSSRL